MSSGSNQQTLPEDSPEKPYSYWAVSALFLSSLGTNTAVILWIFLDVPIFISYMLCAAGFVCAVVALIVGSTQKNKGRRTAEAAVVVSILWIPIFLMVYWGEQPPTFIGLSYHILGPSPEALKENPDLRMFDDYDPGIVIGYGPPMGNRKDLLNIKLPNGRALRLPGAYETKIRQVYFNNYRVRLVEEEKLKELLDAQEVDVQELQERYETFAGNNPRKFFNPKWVIKKK